MEIEKLEGGIGILFPDREKAAAKESLKKRLKGLLEELESKSRLSEKNRK